MKYISILLIILLISSCINTGNNITSEKIDSGTTNFKEYESHYKEREINLDLKNSKVVYITLDSENTISNNSGIQISNQKIIIKKSGNYEFSGTLNNGQIIVETEDEKNVQIILNNVNITNHSGPTIFIKSTSQAIINLADKSINTLIDGSSYSDNKGSENANIFSTEDLVINGNGTLNVIGNYNDGITSKDKLFIDSGVISVIAKDDGIRGKDYLLINDGYINIKSEGDSLRSDNKNKATILINGGKINISSGDDALHSELYLIFNGGNINILKSYEGVESKYITFNSGIINIISSDDGINASSGIDNNDDDIIGGMFSKKGGGNQDDGSVVYFNGGEVTLNANGDGFDSNGKIIMTGGKIIIFGPEKNNNGSIDYNGSFIITGGEVLAIGSNGMVQTPGKSDYINTLNISLDTNYQSGQNIILNNSSGDELFNINSIKTFQNIIFSSKNLIIGEKYSYYIDGIKIGDIILDGSITTVGEIKKIEDK